MADMFNHGTQNEAVIHYDDEGSCCVYTTMDVPAGSPIRVSYTNGDNTNPSFLFARYGFLDQETTATFCKIMIDKPSQKVIAMGYHPSKMLFYKDTGEVSSTVWDVLLYQILGELNPDHQQAFYEAHKQRDTETKQAMHQYYFPETAAALIDHVDTFLQQLEEVSSKTVGQDIQQHPRIPLILEHNHFVRNIFLTVRNNVMSQLEQLSY
jgi:hypothetical protein